MQGTHSPASQPASAPSAAAHRARPDDVRRQAGERQEPAYVGGVRPHFSARSVIDFARPLSIFRRHRCVRTSALTKVSSRRGVGVGTADPSGVMISFRPPCRCSGIGTRWERPAISRSRSRFRTASRPSSTISAEAVANQPPVLAPYPRARVSRMISTANADVSTAASRRPRSIPRSDDHSAGCPAGFGRRGRQVIDSIPSAVQAVYPPISPNSACFAGSRHSLHQVFSAELPSTTCTLG
jgi:hypothetical protein